MMSEKEKELASKIFELVSDQFANNICNDVDESFYDGWTIEERRQFVKEFHDFNGDPQEYDENFLHLPDYALFGFLSWKLLNNK